MYGLGLRVGEVHALNLESLDLEENTLSVTGKGKKRRVMYLTGELPRILAEYLAIRSHFLNAENLPAVIYMNQLVQTGAMILKFQSKARYKPNLRKVVLN